MLNLYYHKTSIGTFYIAKRKDRFHPVFKELSLGSYISPEQAADDLSGGHVFPIDQDDVDVSELGIPCDLVEWSRI